MQAYFCMCPKTRSIVSNREDDAQFTPTFPLLYLENRLYLLKVRVSFTFLQHKAGGVRGV